jgi:hypothetical protein
MKPYIPAKLYTAKCLVPQSLFLILTLLTRMLVAPTASNIVALTASNDVTPTASKNCTTSKRVYNSNNNDDDNMHQHTQHREEDNEDC